MHYSVIFCNTESKKLFLSQSQHFPFRGSASLCAHKLAVKIAVSFANTPRQKVFAACLQAAQKILSRHIFFSPFSFALPCCPLNKLAKDVFQTHPPHSLPWYKRLNPKKSAFKKPILRGGFFVARWQLCYTNCILPLAPRYACRRGKGKDKSRTRQSSARFNQTTATKKF